MDQRAPPSMHGYYAAGPGYGGVPVSHMMRGGPHFIDHPQIIHNVDYVADHFQGVCVCVCVLCVKCGCEVYT